MDPHGIWSAGSGSRRETTTDKNSKKVKKFLDLEGCSYNFSSCKILQYSVIKTLDPDQGMERDPDPH
jgi:hypothetical protein